MSHDVPTFDFSPTVLPAPRQITRDHAAIGRDGVPYETGGANSHADRNQKEVVLYQVRNEQS